MGDKTIYEYEWEIRAWENRISIIVDRKEEVKKLVTEPTSESALLQKEREGLSKELMAMGFLKFKEKKLIKAKMDEINKKNKKNEITLRVLENTSTALEQQVNELRSQINASQEQKKALQREKDFEDGLAKGDPQAQYEMGLKNRDSDFKKALEWLEKASRQGHAEAQKLKTEIENEKIYFGVANDSAWDIVEFNVFHNSVHTNSFRERLLSTPNGGNKSPVQCSLPKGVCQLNRNGEITISVEYKVDYGMLIHAVKKQDVRIVENPQNFSYGSIIYLDWKPKIG